MNWLTLLKGLIDRFPVKNSILAGTSGATMVQLALSLLASFGIIVPPPFDTLAVMGIGFIITHYVPDSLQDNMRELIQKGIDISSLIPSTYPDYDISRNNGNP